MFPFLAIPTEIRLIIWANAIAPRIVPVRFLYRRIMIDGQQVTVPNLVSSAPVPSVLRVCQESRSVATKYLAKLCHGRKTRQTTTIAEQDTYVWVCFDLDIVDIGKEYFSMFETNGNLIRRLRFKADNCEEWWYRTEARDLDFFTSLQQCFVDAIDSWEGWVEAHTEHPFQCEAENLWVIDIDRGRMMSFPEIDAWYEIEDKYDRDDEFGINPNLAVDMLPY